MFRKHKGEGSYGAKNLGGWGKGEDREQDPQKVIRFDNFAQIFPGERGDKIMGVAKTWRSAMPAQAYAEIRGSIWPTFIIPSESANFSFFS